MKNKNLVEKDKYQAIWITGLILTFCGALFYSTFGLSFSQIDKLIPSIVMAFILWPIVIWLSWPFLQRRLLMISFIVSSVLLFFYISFKGFVLTCVAGYCPYLKLFDFFNFFLVVFISVYICYSICSIIFWSLIFSVFPLDKLQINLKKNTRVYLLILVVSSAVFLPKIIFFLSGNKIFVF